MTSCPRDTIAAYTVTDDDDVATKPSMKRDQNPTSHSSLSSCPSSLIAEAIVI